MPPLLATCLPNDPLFEASMKRIPFFPSPHYSLRPEGLDVDMIVLHAISLPDGMFEMQHVTSLFMGTLHAQDHASFAALQGVQVSAHFVVARNGQISQFVATNQRAWHAGVSSWQGRDDCNDYAIGIEMVGDERQPFTAQQYTETARLCRVLSDFYPKIHKKRIVGHQDVAPTRKWDPGKQWDWQHFYRSFAHIKNISIDFQA